VAANHSAGSGVGVVSRSWSIRIIMILTIHFETYALILCTYAIQNNLDYRVYNIVVLSRAALCR